MAMYCRVESGSVVEGPRSLPSVWKQVSGFPFLSDAEKRNHGWYPGEITQPDFDPTIQTRTGPEFTILEDHVQAVWTVQDRPLADVKTDLVARLKADAQIKILANHPEYKQRNASLGILESVERDILVADIQNYRNSCNTAETNINAATTAAEAVNAFDLWNAV